MELWFWAAIVSAVAAGLSNVYFKIAAARGYHAEVFSLYGVLVTNIGVVVVYTLFPGPLFGHGWVAFLVFFGGFIAAISGILKVFALRHVDTTIYFPLFKLLAPFLAIIFGIVFFGERFSVAEWLGLLLGLMIPLLLISKKENGRQNNLFAGLVLVLITGVISASAAAFNKLGIEQNMTIMVAYAYMAFGLLIGNIVAISYKVGIVKILYTLKKETTMALVVAGSMRALLIFFSVLATLFAFAQNGPLGVVQTIHSMYILIPVILSVIFYHEHWNIQKAIAILLSVAALALLG